MTALDWNSLATKDKVHICTCDYCDMSGETEPPELPVLITLKDRAGNNYVTNKYIMLKEEAAPVPEDYKGIVISAPENSVEHAIGEIVLLITEREPPADWWFHDSVIKALEHTGWTLRITQETIRQATSRVCAVIGHDGQPVGWAVTSAGQPTADARKYKEKDAARSN